MKILLVEDEINLANAIINYLKTLNYDCELASTYSEGLSKISSFLYDCIVLDLMLPGGDGLLLLREIKHLEREDGIIIVSARGALEDKINGLQMGADDYLAKPFHLAELGARIYSVIRRKQFRNTNYLSINELTIDFLLWEVSVENKRIPLTKIEFDLLLYLIGSKNKIISKASIAEHLYGEISDSMNNFDIVYTHIKNLKKKMADSGCREYIKTVYGIGYRWTSDEKTTK